MSAQIIPLTSAPNQSLRVTGEIDGATLTLSLRVRFNEIALYWILTISDASNNPLLDSLPLTTGWPPAANILGQNASLGIGSMYVINASGVDEDYPDASNLGTDFVLLWADTE